MRGDLDVGAWNEFPQQVSRLAGEAAYPILDLREVTYIDMRGIRELERLAAAAQSRGGRLVIARPSPIVRRVLDLLDLSAQMVIVSSRGDAVAFVAQHSSQD